MTVRKTDDRNADDEEEVLAWWRGERRKEIFVPDHW
jgi:hypothetical protein